MLLQAVPPVPPIPPAPGIPFDPNSPTLVMIVLASLVAIVIVLWPIARALARRLEGKSPLDPAVRGDLEQLHQRLAEIESLQLRVAELEDRIDFAERLLARPDGATAPLPREQR